MTFRENPESRQLTNIRRRTLWREMERSFWQMVPIDAIAGRVIKYLRPPGLTLKKPSGTNRGAGGGRRKSIARAGHVVFINPSVSTTTTGWGFEFETVGARGVVKWPQGRTYMNSFPDGKWKPLNKSSDEGISDRYAYELDTLCDEPSNLRRIRPSKWA